MKTKKYKKLDFPEMSDIDISFGRFPKEWFSNALKRANNEGFTGYSQTKWEKRFSSLFFRGGEFHLDHSLDKQYLENGKRIFLAIAQSFYPKHEHKTAVCALILKNIELDCEK